MEVFRINMAHADVIDCEKREIISRMREMEMEHIWREMLTESSDFQILQFMADLIVDRFICREIHCNDFGSDFWVLCFWNEGKNK